MPGCLKAERLNARLSVCLLRAFLLADAGPQSEGRDRRSCLVSRSSYINQTKGCGISILNELSDLKQGCLRF